MKDFNDIVEKIWPEKDTEIQVYLEDGSIDKKTGKKRIYEIERNIKTGKILCSCPSHGFRHWQDCKHIKKLKTKINW